MACLTESLLATGAGTYSSKEAFEKLMVVNDTMDGRLLPRHRGCQRVDPKCLQASGAKVARQQRILGCAVLYEVLCEVIRQTTETLEPCLSPKSVI
jgi:hypothetical protein